MPTKKSKRAGARRAKPAAKKRVKPAPKKKPVAKKKPAKTKPRPASAKAAKSKAAKSKHASGRAAKSKAASAKPAKPKDASGNAAKSTAAKSTAAKSKAAKSKAAATKAAPKQAAPKKAAPAKAAPTKAAPKEAAPKKAAPAKAAPTKATPKRAAPTEVAPTQAAPKPSAALGADTKLPEMSHHPVSLRAMDEVAHEGLRAESGIAHVEDGAFAPCRLVDHGDGRTSLCFDDFRMPRVPLFEERGLQGGGYTWEAVVASLVKMRRPDLEPVLGYDSEAGMFVAVGPREALAAVAGLIQAALADPALLAAAVDAADPDRLE